MMEFFDLKYTILIVALLNFIIGSFVLGKNIRNKVNRTFALTAFILSFWSISMFFYVHPFIFDSLFWIRVVYLFVILMVGAWGYFFSIFPVVYERRKIYLIFFFILGPVFAYFLLFTNTWVVDVIEKPWGPDTIVGPAYVSFGFFIFVAMAWIIYLSLKNIFRLTGSAKMQAIYVFLGVISYSILASIFDVIIPIATKDSSYFWISTYFSLLFVVACAYAIIRHRLMDIKFVLRRYSVYLASLVTIILLAIGVKYFFDLYFPDFTNSTDFVILLLAISIFTPIKNYYYRLANKYFFSSLYDSSEVIAGMSEKLRSTLDLKRIYTFISETLVNAFHVKAIGILNYSNEKGVFSILFNNGFKTGNQKDFPQDEELFKLFLIKGEPIVVDEIKRLAYLKFKPTIDLLLKLKVEIVTPLNIKDKVIGLIALGGKESKDMYNDEDLKVLKVVGAQAAIAIENALLYQETKNFNIKLEKEVERATRDLRRANEQLKKLDAAKSEFISIASHQLRTPLTVIKGYISMMLEGNFGKLSKDEKESLDKVFESNERLIQLVENLLNISRIESGRMQFQFENERLEKVVDSVIDELIATAKKKGLRLDYIKPQVPLLKVKIDPEKIRQVILNLIDNSIKYTKRGGITIKLELVGKKVRFSVADTGMGINKDEIPNLFKKFSRGTGTALVHTEGTGLGLYVARMMIEAHQGKIWAESAGTGKGSKFCFELNAIK